MNFPLKIAKRYLFAKKSTNAINIITGISVFGVTIGTAALVIVLSVFNGFEDLLTSLFNNFNPDIKVTPMEGKVFTMDSTKIADLEALQGVDIVAKTLEEVAFFEYQETQLFGVVKGVDRAYKKVSDIDSTIIEGEFLLEKKNVAFAVAGQTIANRLGINVQDDFEELAIFMAKKNPSKMSSPFRKLFARPSGIFKIQQDFDSKYILTPLTFTQQLLGYKKGEISALEIRINASVDAKKTQAAIEDLVGAQFDVKDSYQQEEGFLKLMNMEKWLFFALFTFMIIIIAFNLIGALWMMVLEKKHDIAILKSMGARDTTIRNIFLNQGMFLCIIGILSGFALAVIVYILQKTVGIVTIPDGFVVDTYPMEIRFFDFLKVGTTVLVIGLLASLPSAMKASQIPAMIQEE
ncbi:MAG: lipoprotein-releasing system permease protein [Paraglaciecola sp.]